MPVLASLVATLLRLRARACVVLACVAAMLCAAGIASANTTAETKTRVWDFSFAAPLNIRPIGPASSRTHPENRSANLEHASDSPHAARAGAAAGKAAPRMLRSAGSMANTFRGPKITNELAEALGMERRGLGKALESIKKAAGLGGRDNVVINRASGDVFDPRTEEYIGNVLDEFVK